MGQEKKGIVDPPGSGGARYKRLSVPSKLKKMKKRNPVEDSLMEEVVVISTKKM